MGIGTLNNNQINLITLDKGDSSDSFGSPTKTPIAKQCFGEFNAEPLNLVAVDSCLFFSSLGVQLTIKIAQLVGSVIDSNNVISISQDIEPLSKIDSNNVISISQDVSITTPSFNLVKISQIVNGPDTYLSVKGWDVDILINGLSIPKDRIKGLNVTITKESNQNTLCVFGVIVDNPSEFLAFIDGGQVIVNYMTLAGVTRLFTGIVDLPEINIIEKYIKINCSDRREELIKAQMLPLLPTIGRYSKEVQGEITSVKQEVDYRLETIPMDLDFDSFNTPNLNSWYPKQTADFILDNSHIFYRTPQITWQSRGSIVNDITVTMKYDYTRLYQYQRSFSWTDSGDPSYTVDPATGYRVGTVWKKDTLASHATVGMVQSAIDQAGWKSLNSLTYVDHYPPIDPTTNNTGVFDPLANFNYLNDDLGTTRTQELAPPYAFITQYYAIPPATIAETRIISAAWTASTRFSQNIEEIYTCQIKSSQSISQFGDLTDFSNYNVADTFDSKDWDSYNLSTPLPSNIVTNGVNFWANENPAIATFNNAILTAIDRAKTKIIGSHRDTKVTLQLPIQPAYELRHTIQVNSSRLQCTGKLTKIIHTLDLSQQASHTTAIDITLFRSTGTAIETPTTVPARPIDSPVFDTATIMFGTRRDQDPAITPGGSTWNGYIGSINNGFQNPLQTKFIVDTPAIPDALRQLRTLTSNSVYETSLTSDNLEIIF